ncbi:glycine--tRNA ligase-like protein [Leptotrombidium deliense]|uniref:glycine--tRNA ligase n=1 Tax=Leptotrombidium deliense TaxID=299467 RepID=A0A443SG56_9ACAR|nr:glycine--tRNA ligase-like protein [Leptotrombidium deliense]
MEKKNILDDVMKRRFLNSSFEIYDGIARFYDLGPLGTKLYENIIECWKLLFVKQERSLHIKCPVITPAKVLSASGHLQRFTDVFVKDMQTGEMFRLDHLISDNLNARLSTIDKNNDVFRQYEEIISSLNHLTIQEMQSIVEEYSILSPSTGNQLSKPFERNLMFKTVVGSSDDVYLRPELSQSAFVNFTNYYLYNKGRLPFAVSQIGSAFRNEATTRSSGITRLREFTLAELLYFFDPQQTSHPKYKSVKDVQLNFLSACAQREDKQAENISLEEAVNRNLVNEIMAYFFAKTQLFFREIGVDVSKLRFRQHSSNELAHYAKSCWDAECLTSSGGWLECAGISDRNCFDLENHTRVSKSALTFNRSLTIPVLKKFKEFEFAISMPDELVDRLNDKTNEEKEEIERQLNENGEFYVKDFTEVVCLKRGLVKLVESLKEVDTEQAFAHVIEPSFGIERIMYTVFDHNLRLRKNNERKVYFTFPANISPIKCKVFPLGSNDDHKMLASKVDEYLHSNGIECELDDARLSIGKRYVKSDEIGTPYGVTVDFDSLLEPHSVTLRDRDSTMQVRVPIESLVDILNNLISGKVTFESLTDQFPIFTGQLQSKTTN